MELAAEITALVRAQLRAAHAAIGQLLEKLEGPKPFENPSTRAQDSGGKVPSPETRQADWPALREALRQRIAKLGGNYVAVSKALGCSPRTIEAWASANSAPPGRDAGRRLRRWLSQPAEAPNDAAISHERESVEADAAPGLEDRSCAFRLTGQERDRLSGYIAHGGDARELRDQFGASRELLQRAAEGQHLAAEVVARLRTALQNGAA